MRRAVLGAVATAAVSIPAVAPAVGCALTSRGEDVHVVWYTPERTYRSVGIAELQRTCPLRFGRVTSGADLGPRIAFGDGMYKVEYYEARRWTERPEHFVRRAAQRALFEEGMFQRTLSAGAPTVDLELIDFEEINASALHAARVAVRVVVTSDRRIFEHTVETRHSVGGPSFNDFVAAMAAALEEAARQVAIDTAVVTNCHP